eukprot:CAMPEP_0181209058 /NCGR_PEP_ID=MMETSP1096-20121128/22457_1 /TAXON_ID=156174 ORGANISM="Chrysochromulina ericina, Strain CCMP281" /NCGR_SAMPLE_ID=MMETSP1096 /ASSEMBLY_ACC=CAM_ASM_000453 /LENGTH=122 /DNA_ID=CAMNT_0023300181 /DNA_START=8 /DNA_END=376 /DNA_ORIENTATION=+
MDAERAAQGSAIHRENSYISHRFAVRLSENGALVSHITIDRTSVTDCPDNTAPALPSRVAMSTPGTGIRANHSRAQPSWRRQRKRRLGRISANECVIDVAARIAGKNATGTLKGAGRVMGGQ